MRKFRKLNQFYAWLMGYFWLPCPICGEMFGGHEISDPIITSTNQSGESKVACWRHNAKT